MSEPDATLRTRVGDEVARAGDVIPPPLTDLEARASGRRRRRWAGWGVGAAAAAAVVLAAVQLWPGASGGMPFAGGPALPEGAQEFAVPTYDWNGNGMDALVTGRLGFTDDGCTLMYQEGDAGSVEPVIFPDAVGVRFANGVRAVVHEGTRGVFAVEGQEFSYGGGGLPASELWSGRCGDWAGSIWWINDEPAGAPLTADPAPPERPAPTRVATDEEQGLYDVPTFDWDPAQGGDQALLEGTVTMTADGCAVVEASEPPRTTGLVLPHARGMLQGDGRPTIYSAFPDGSESLMAEEGMPVSFTGGATGDAGLQALWQRLCPASPVDALFLVQDESP